MPFQATEQTGGDPGSCQGQELKVGEETGWKIWLLWMSSRFSCHLKEPPAASYSCQLNLAVPVETETSCTALGGQAASQVVIGAPSSCPTVYSCPTASSCPGRGSGFQEESAQLTLVCCYPRGRAVSCATATETASVTRKPGNLAAWSWLLSW